MYKLLSLVVALFLVFLFPNLIYANGAGLPPFFKINGKDTIVNPLQIFGITAQSFLIPQDFTPEKYLVNKPINFTIDERQLEAVIPHDLLKKTRFAWDFGDGTKADGLQNTHTYTKQGSYILILTISIYEVENNQPTQFIDSFLIHVIPSKDFHQLPQAVIKVNGSIIKDPTTKLADVNFNNPINFDASDSIALSSKIIAYMWNFGDGETSSEKVVTHKYGAQSFRTVVLRVKDARGFISDAFVGLNNNPKLKSTVILKKKIQYSLFVVPIIVAVSFLLLIIVRHRRK